MVGDFNLVMDPKMDYYNYLHVNNPKAREKVIEIVSQLNLTDIYRELHPDNKRFPLLSDGVSDRCGG